MSMRELDKAQSGGELLVRVGETLELKLPENPTKGYRWQLSSSGSPVLYLVEDDFTPTGTAVGTGGMRHWTFRVEQAGAAQLELELRRSWERQAMDTFGITIRATAK
jgi:inhibitor of cysteine peptidase